MINPLYTLIIRAILSVAFMWLFAQVLDTVLEPGAEFSPSAEKLAIYILGALTANLISIGQYWFGSTQGSSDKTAAMARRDQP